MTRSKNWLNKKWKDRPWTSSNPIKTTNCLQARSHLHFPCISPVINITHIRETFLTKSRNRWMNTVQIGNVEQTISIGMMQLIIHVISPSRNCTYHHSISLVVAYHNHSRTHTSYSNLVSYLWYVLTNSEHSQEQALSAFSPGNTHLKRKPHVLVGGTRIAIQLIIHHYISTYKHFPLPLEGIS